MNFKHPVRNIAVTLLTGLAIIIVACSNNGNTTPKKYSGPGSKWDVTFNGDGTFGIDKYASASATTTDFTVTGTYTDLSTGFKKLTVGAVTGTGGPAVGDLAYGLEVPGYVFVLKPLSGDQIIPMVISGACPEADFTDNWVLVNMPASASVASTDISGTFHYDYATATPSLPTKYTVAGTALGAGTIGTGSCSKGLMTIGDVEMYLTDSGGAIVHTNLSNPTESSFIFGFKQKAITDINSLDGNYAGLVFNESAASGDQVKPVKLTCSAGVCTGNQLSDVETGATTGTTVTLTLNTPDSPSSGLVLGTASAGSSTGNIICMVDKDAASSGRNIVSCAGQDPGNSAMMFNALFTSL